MDDCLVIVADGASARMFHLQKEAALQAGSRLVEKMKLTNTAHTARGTDAPRVRSERNTSRQAGPIHPQDAERDWHRMEVDRRFAREITAHASAMLKAGGARRLVLVAEPRMLGLLRPGMRAVVSKRVTVSELARNHTHLTPSRLHQRLVADELIR